MLYMGQMRWLTLWSSSTLFPLLPFQYVWRLSDAFFYANYYYLNRNIPFVNNPRKLQFCSISVSYLYLYHSWRCKWHMHKNFCVGPKKHFRVKRIIKITLYSKNIQFSLLSVLQNKEEAKQLLQPLWTKFGSTYRIQHQCTALSLPKTPDLVPCMKTYQASLHSRKNHWLCELYWCLIRFNNLI